MTVVFYVSGHGFGHAVRTSGVIAALRALRPAWQIIVRTTAQPSLFPDPEQVHHCEIDSGAVEGAGSLRIDTAETVLALQRFLGKADGIVADETEFIRNSGARLLIADIPYLPGEIARASGVPALAIGNFTWDWIYEPMLPPGGVALERIRSAYTGIVTALRLPFSQPTGWGMFGEVLDVPLLCRKPIQAKRFDPRPTVLLGGRGQLDVDILKRASSACPDFFFLAIAERQRFYNGNLLLRPLGPDFTFGHAMAASDIVLAKLGYSLVADCVAAEKRILYPPRTGFREDVVMQAEVGLHVPAMPIPVAEYLAGDWESYLRKVAELPSVISELSTNGAEECAKRIVANCEG